MDPHDEVLLQRVGQTMAGRWTLRSLIGSGGMAAVYAATNSEGQSVAIKLLHPEMGMRKDIRERFLREAAVMARIVHPGMVTIYEQGQSGELAYLAMELLHGETFSARVRRTGRLEPNEVLVVLDQVLDVLNVAHSMGIVHRDLKPENLFLTHEGRIKVLDFGLVRLLDAGPDSFRTRTGAALGTLPYMAPEQALGRRDEVDARTDLFAVGATAYRLLSGHRIHEAPSEAELLMCMASEPANPLLKVAPDLAPDLGAVVDRALAFAKTSRYPDAATMQRDVRSLLSGQPPEYANFCRERDECATNVDRVAPKLAATAPLPNSTRPLHAAIAVPPTALDPGAPPTEPHAAQPNSPHVLLATVAMPASQRDAKTVLDPSPVVAAAPASAAVAGASIPNAPFSDAVLERKRRQTVVVGLLLLFGMLGVATTAGWYFLRPSSRAEPLRRASTTTATPTSLAPRADPSNPLHRASDAPMRHPAHLLTPEEDPPLPHEGSARSGTRPNNSSVTSPPTSVPASPAVPATNQHQSNLLPTPTAAPATAAAGPAPVMPATRPAPAATTPPMNPPVAAATPAQPNVAPPANAQTPVATTQPSINTGKPKRHGKKRH